MQPSDVPVAGLVALGVAALVCLVGPLLVQARWARGRRRLWASFGLGALTFAVSQLLSRIPLITRVLPALPEWQALLGNAVSAAVVLSLSAAVFEETGRLIVMGTFLRRTRRTHADGVAFGLGHGGLEAFVLVGLGLAGLLVLGVAVRAGVGDALTAGMSDQALAALRTQLGGVSVSTAVMAVLERVSAVALHVGLSVLVLLGVVRGRPLIAWVLAMAVHTAVNFVAVVALTVWGWPAPAVEGLLFLVGIAAVVWVVRAGRAFPAPAPADRGSAPPDRGDRGPGQRDEVGRG